MSCKENLVEPTVSTPKQKCPESDTIKTIPMPDTTSEEKTYKILALGDSYTIGESVSASERYPNQLADSLRQRGFDIDTVQIIAQTGWRTDDLDRAITAANIEGVYDLVFLLIGVNNFYQRGNVEAYKPEFTGLLNRALGYAGNKKENVIVVSIPDYGYTPFGRNNQPTISKGIDSFNSANKAISELAQVSYVNITDISREGFRDPSLVANDGLHPSGKMYSLWVERILPIIKK
ncbi:MAG TPA: SGNH/GDSL hydrolase family protein [Cytophagaceae bacterium]